MSISLLIQGYREHFKIDRILSIEFELLELALADSKIHLLADNSCLV
jgi:hypothetical protein